MIQKKERKKEMCILALANLDHIFLVRCSAFVLSLLSLDDSFSIFSLIVIFGVFHQVNCHQPARADPFFGFGCERKAEKKASAHTG